MHNDDPKAGLAEYLDGAELQIETDEQRAALRRALEEVLESDVKGEYAKALIDIVKAHFVPAKPMMLAEPTLMRDTPPRSARDSVSDTLRILQPVALTSTAKCFHHPGRNAVITYDGRPYCQQCSDGITSARKKVLTHVEPKECFVWYMGSDTWDTISGTGCAHWVAHQLGFDPGSLSESCIASRAFRIPTLIKGRPSVARKDVQVRDIMVTEDEKHCGLVIGVTASAATINIRHDSSGQGGVVQNDFDSFFKGKGTFYR